MYRLRTLTEFFVRSFIHVFCFNFLHQNENEDIVYKKKKKNHLLTSIICRTFSKFIARFSISFCGEKKKKEICIPLESTKNTV